MSIEDAIKQIISSIKATEWKLYRDRDCTDEVVSHPFLSILNEADKRQTPWGRVMSEVAISGLTETEEERDNGQQT